MIAIIGMNEEDILYYKAKMNINETKYLFNKIPVYIGLFSNNEIVLTYTEFGNYNSSIVTSLIINTYQPYLVINVGNCASLTHSLVQGDIFIAERYYNSETDAFLYDGSAYGQIPNQKEFFLGNNILSNKAESSSYIVSDAYCRRGSLLSSEKFLFDGKPYKKLVDSHFIKDSNIMAVDNMSTGVALACEKFEVALLSLKAVAYQMNEEEQELNYRRIGLSTSVLIGKIITHLLVSKKSL